MKSTPVPGEGELLKNAEGEDSWLVTIADRGEASLEPPVVRPLIDCVTECCYNTRQYPIPIQSKDTTHRIGLVMVFKFGFQHWRIPPWGVVLDRGHLWGLNRPNGKWTRAAGSTLKIEVILHTLIAESPIVVIHGGGVDCSTIPTED
jgi:hypothetical protein